MALACMAERHTGSNYGALRMACAGLLALFLSAPPLAAADEWKFDEVRLKNGNSFHGLITRETPGEVRMQVVGRRPGSPIIVYSSTFQRNEINHLERLEAADREVLASRVQALLRERKLSEMLKGILDPGQKGSATQLEKVDLKPVSWARENQSRALSLESAHFRLVSNAQKEVVELAAVHLELIYAAFTRFLPPRCMAAQPTVILMPQSLADYQALLQERRLNLLNPAFYDPSRNEIICASDLQRLSEDLARVGREHLAQCKDLDEQEAKLKKVYKGKIPDAFVKQMKDARDSITQKDKKNLREAEVAARRLFARLYHEAFHAYLANFVYPPSQGEVPRWLNEGLAQMFETALDEVGELRIERPDRSRLQQVQSLTGKGELVGLTDLLRSGPKQFHVVHGSDRQTSDRYYLTAWALAYYLTIDRKLLGTKALDDYVKGLHRGKDPVEAFGELVSQSPAPFEKDFRAYVLQLRPDGTGGPAPGK